MTFYFFFNVFFHLKIHVFFILTLLPFSYHMVLNSINSSTRHEMPHDAPPHTWTPPRRAASLPFQFPLQLPFLFSFPCSRHRQLGCSAPPSPAAPARHCWIWLLGDRDVQMCPRLARTLSDKSSANDLMVQGCKPSNFIKFPADHSLLHLFYCISAGFRKRRKDCIDIS